LLTLARREKKRVEGGINTNTAEKKKYLKTPREEKTAQIYMCWEERGKIPDPANKEASSLTFGGWAVSRSKGTVTSGAENTEPPRQKKKKTRFRSLLGQTEQSPTREREEPSRRRERTKDANLRV